MLNISGLLNTSAFDPAVGHIELLETHISWVLMTGDYVYKIKKPVNLGFLDFSSLDKRHYYCQEELRLNRRLAPDYYLDVIPIYGTAAEPRFYGGGEIIEYAVKMREFAQSAQLDRLLQNTRLPGVYLDAIAEVVASFHQRVAIALPDSEYGHPVQVWQPVAENFEQILKLESEADSLRLLNELSQWCQTQFLTLSEIIAQRKHDGFVRECHGDLHLGNIAWVNGRPLIFDCIEFNPVMRWIDVISDLAFLFMDLSARGESALALAYRLLDRYLSVTGDYAGLQLLPFYVVYRAMVRAKVSRIRSAQISTNAQAREAERKQFNTYLAYASIWVSWRRPALLITWGMSASGKSTISEGLLESLHAVRLRSDVERKRLAGIKHNEAAAAATDMGIYTSDMTQRTYEYLLSRAAVLLDTGFVVIVDATFLDKKYRSEFARLSQEKGVAFIILQCHASPECLRRRIQKRRHDVSDADLAILEQQLARNSALSANELAKTVYIDTEKSMDFQQLSIQVLNRISDISGKG